MASMSVVTTMMTAVLPVVATIVSIVAAIVSIVAAIVALIMATIPPVIVAIVVAVVVSISARASIVIKFYIFWTLDYRIGLITFHSLIFPVFVLVVVIPGLAIRYAWTRMSCACISDPQQ